MGRAFQALTRADIVEVNRLMIKRFGGIYVPESDNLLNPGSLDHLIAMTQGLVLESDPYPSDIQKCALYPSRIISGHIFMDGNKRTGMESCRLALEMNGYEMLVDAEVIEMALRIANRDVEFEQLTEWLETRSRRKGVA